MKWFARRLAYQHVGTFKGILFLIGLVLIISVLVYSQILVDRLRNATRHSLEQKIRTYSMLIKSDVPDLIGVALEQIQEVDFPIVVTDSLGNPKHWKNLSILPTDTSGAAIEKVRRVIRTMDERGNAPLPVPIGAHQVEWFHYGDSLVIRQLRWLPWFEIIAAALFVIVGYTGFGISNAAKSGWSGLVWRRRRRTSSAHRSRL